ncbi:MAG: hypothetical protein JNL48_10195 [Acidobacteria bacterium]|nr:hypothetical protein [Acidobacteriota bacterium]
MDGSQHRGQVPLQLDPQLAAPRGQDNRINQPAEAFRRLQPGVVAPERGGQFLHLGPIQVGHARVEQRRGLVRGLELGLKCGLPLLKTVVTRLELRAGVALDDGVDDLFDVALDSIQLAPGTAQAGALFHPEPVHLLRELSAELLEEVLAQQLLLQRRQHARLDLLARDRQFVGARAAFASAEAAEPIAVVDDEAGAALAALGQAGEQVFRAHELVEALGGLCCRPLLLHAGVTRLHGLPQLVVHDAQGRHRGDHPLGRRVLA